MELALQFQKVDRSSEICHDEINEFSELSKSELLVICHCQRTSLDRSGA